MKTYMVTGVSGFIGSHLVDYLLSDGHEVIGVDKVSLPQHLAFFDPWSTDRFLFELCDLSERHPPIDDRIDAIFHQAADNSAARSWDNPVATYTNNVKSFQNVLEYALKRGVKRVIFASSSSVYGVDRGFGVRSPYAASKLANEALAIAYRNYHTAFKLTGLRYFNVYGPRQKVDHRYGAVIPKWIDLLLNDKDITIKGDGMQSRAFTYVNDVVQANLAALVSPPGFYDVGHIKSTRIRTLATILKHLTGKHAKLEKIVRPKWEVMTSVPVMDFATLKFDPKTPWEAKIDLETGLKKTIEWYKRYI